MSDVAAGGEEPLGRRPVALVQELAIDEPDDVRDFAAEVGGENEFAIAEELATGRDVGASPERGAADRIDAFELVVVLKDDAAGRDRAKRAEGGAGRAVQSLASEGVVERPAIVSGLELGGLRRGRATSRASPSCD